MGKKPKIAKEASADKKAMERDMKILVKSPCSSPKKTTSKYIKSDVRRSGRLQKSIVPAGTELGAVEIDLTDNKMEEVRPQVEKIQSHQTDDRESEKRQVEQVNPNPTVEHPTEEEIRMEEKIDYLYHIAKELKSKVAKRHMTSGSTSEDVNYKNLYIDSKKKIEALTEENFELAKKLEYARGKNDAYENVNDTLGKWMQTNLGRVSETHKNDHPDLFPQPKETAPSPSRQQQAAAAPNPSPLRQDAQAILATRSSKRKKTSLVLKS